MIKKREVSFAYRTEKNSHMFRGFIPESGSEIITPVNWTRQLFRFWLLIAHTYWCSQYHWLNRTLLHSGRSTMAYEEYGIYKLYNIW